MADQSKCYRSVPARVHAIDSFRVLGAVEIGESIDSRMQYTSSLRAPSLLWFSSAVGWLSGVLFDERPPRVPVYISAAVKSRNEISPQGNADVPSRTTAGGFLY